jgi:hypothetical protein
MHSLRNNAIESIAISILICLLSVLTVNRYSPEYLNADVIINSVMSLQKVTLFYWGQNRLLNVLPFIGRLFREVVLNLYFLLIFTTLCHYLLLLLFIKVVLDVSENVDGNFVLLKGFTLLSLLFLVVLKGQSIFSIAIAHIEYPLPVLLVGVPFLYATEKRFSFYLWLALSSFCIFLATGLNHSIILLTLALVSAYLMYTKILNYRVILLGIVSLVAVIVWSFISSCYGSVPYSEFSVHQLHTGIISVISSLSDAFILLYFALVLIVFLSCEILDIVLNLHRISQPLRLPEFALKTTGFFCLSWLIFFCSNKWVAMNQYNYRYFTFLIYGIIIYFTFHTLKILNIIGMRLSWIVTGLSFLFLLVTLWSGFVPLGNYSVFRAVESLVPDHYQLYAGDYWLVWPAVFRDMMTGKPSFGLSYRGDGNREGAKAFVKLQLSERGSFSVICLNDKIDNCKNQISEVLGPFPIKEVVYQRDGINELILIQPATVLSR